MNFKQWLEQDEITKAKKSSKLNLSKYDPDQLKMGYEAEKEHDDGSDVDVVDKKSDLVKIAVAHLREDPKYYTKLKKVEKPGS